MVGNTPTILCKLSLYSYLRPCRFQEITAPVLEKPFGYQIDIPFSHNIYRPIFLLYALHPTKEQQQNPELQFLNERHASLFI